MVDAFDGKKVHISYIVNRNEDVFCHLLYKIRTLEVQTYDFSRITNYLYMSLNYKNP